MAWLIREGDVLAVVETRRGGRTAGTEGVVVVNGPALVQTLTRPVWLDVAWCGPPAGGGDERFEVRRILALRPYRLARPRLISGCLLVAPGGAFERWRLSVGDRLEIRQV